MRALALTGHHGEALRSYAVHRNHVIEEIGIEPGPDLRALESELLALDVREVTPAGSPTPPQPRMVTVLSVRHVSQGSAWREIVAAHGGDVIAPGRAGRAVFGRRRRTGAIPSGRSVRRRSWRVPPGGRRRSASRPG